MAISVTEKRIAWGLGELSAVTGLSLGLIRKEIRRGALSAKRVGRRILITQEDWDAYLSGKK
jgi:excisionase family DNA binding protein